MNHKIRHSSNKLFLFFWATYVLAFQLLLNYLTWTSLSLENLPSLPLFSLTQVKITLLSPIIEELTFRYWLPRNDKRSPKQELWFWVWVIHIVLFIFPTILKEAPITFFESLVKLPIVVYSYVFTLDRVILFNYLDNLFGVNLMILCSLPAASLLLKITPKWKFLSRLPTRAWYVASIVTFVLSHINTIRHTAATLSIVLSIFMLINFILGGVALSIIYKNYGLKTAIFGHICWNLISTGTIVLNFVL